MKKWYIKTISIIFLGVLSGCGVKKSFDYSPKIADFNKSEFTYVSDTLLRVNQHFLQKNKFNNWELKVSGSPEEIGYYSGVLTEKLYKNQEKFFFLNIEANIPSTFKQKMLVRFLRWYSNEMYTHIADEYQKEIHQLAQFSNDKYNWVAPKFQRALYLHGAHDIGHAMQDLALVGCSSLAVWNENTENNELLIGRNFDFYVGEAFAQNKLIQFIKPNQGYAFASVSWPGMVGVVSGMNVKGVTVTLNAGKSDIGLKAKSPVSIVAREIVQYAKNINEAIEIAKRHEVFVAESLLIGSASERKAVIIEISPKKFDVYEPHHNYTICTNHFQSETYKDDERNVTAFKNSHTQYRFEKIEEKLTEVKQWNPRKMAQMLRETSGLNDVNIGFGNEKSLNQLIAHHAVIFQPEQLKMWVSSSPYQLGEMACYNLNDIFKEEDFTKNNLFVEEENIKASDFVRSSSFANYEIYRKKLKDLDRVVDKKAISENTLIEFQQLNPELWKVYDVSGQIQYKKGYYRAAKNTFTKALSCEIATENDKVRIQKYISKINKKLKCKSK